MARKIKYYLVAAEALPEIFIRVAEAKRMMQTGEADTVGAATKMAGISRSAFYKYKDAVQPFNDMKSEHIITFYTLLKDVSGTLSSVLEYLDAIFNVVIGIEFMKMLCRPSSSNIIEVLTFLIARHMIVQETTPLEDLLSVLSIGILFFFRRFMQRTKPIEEN